MSVIRADVAGRVDGLESYGSSGILEPDGTVLRVAKPLVPDLLIADIQVAAVPTGRNPSNFSMEMTQRGVVTPHGSFETLDDPTQIRLEK